QSDSDGGTRRSARMPAQAYVERVRDRPNPDQGASTQHSRTSRTRTVIARRMQRVSSRGLLQIWRRAFPGYILATEQMEQATLAAARRAAPKHVLETRDIYVYGGVNSPAPVSRRPPLLSASSARPSERS